jgi:hypothetical protein
MSECVAEEGNKKKRQGEWEFTGDLSRRRPPLIFKSHQMQPNLKIQDSLNWITAKLRSYIKTCRSLTNDSTLETD